MKYILTFVAVVAISALLFVYRSDFQAYLPAWANESASPQKNTHASGGGQSKNSDRRGGGAQSGGRAVTVTVAVAKSGSLPVTRQTIGTIVPVASTALSSPISGIVANVLAKDGAEVKAGDLLVQIDDRTIKANIQRDQALLAKDQATLDAADATLSRVETLAKTGVDTQQQVSDASSVAKQAAATLLVDQANLAADNVTLSQTQIRAPFDGKLGAVLFSAGAYVAPGANVALLTQMRPVYAEFVLPEPDLDLIRSTMANNSLTAEVTPTQADVKNSPATGKIVFIDNNVDTASGTFKLRMLLENDAERFWPGQPLKVTVNAGQADNLVIVPMVALQPLSGGYTSFVVKPDNTVEQRQVTVALSNGDLAGVSNGLKEGDALVTEGQASLTNGSHVMVKNPSEGADAGTKISQNGAAL